MQPVDQLTNWSEQEILHFRSDRNCFVYMRLYARIIVPNACCCDTFLFSWSPQQQGAVVIYCPFPNKEYYLEMCCILSGEPIEATDGTIKTYQGRQKFQTQMLTAPCAGGCGTCMW